MDDQFDVFKSPADSSRRVLNKNSVKAFNHGMLSSKPNARHSAHIDIQRFRSEDKEVSSSSKKIDTLYLIGKVCDNENLLDALNLSITKENRFLTINAIKEEEDAYLKGFLVSKKADNVAFVLNEFEGDLYDALLAKKCCIVGPSYLIEYLGNYNSDKIYVFRKRPIYCASMFQASVAFGGFYESQINEVERLTKLVHYMGGLVVSKLSSNVNVFVINSVLSDGYTQALELKNVNIVGSEWITKNWERRDTTFRMACENHNISPYLLKPLTGTFILFHDFDLDDISEMSAMARKSGAVVLTPLHCLKDVTHVVTSGLHALESSPFYKKLLDYDADFQAVSPIWLWHCIHAHKYFKPEDVTTTSVAKVEPANKQVPKLCEDVQKMEISNKENIKNSGKSLNEGIQVAEELIRTEKNYFAVLENILRLFKAPLESHLRREGDAILSEESIRFLFGPIEEIYNLHESINVDYVFDESHWEDICRQYLCSIMGNIHRFFRPYSKIMGDYTHIKATIIRLSMENPRFHAFLKLSEAEPACQRERLVEMIFRIVQRLPSLLLVVKQLRKVIMDVSRLTCIVNEVCINLESLMTRINEDKRNWDNKTLIFDIVNGVKDCPPSLLSSDRKLLRTLHAREIYNYKLNKSRKVIIYVLNDCLEIAKTRKKRSRKSVDKITMRNDINNNMKVYTHRHLIDLRKVAVLHDVKHSFTKSDSNKQNDSSIFGLTFKANVDYTSLYFYMAGENVVNEKILFLNELAIRISEMNDLEGIEGLIECSDMLTYKVHRKMFSRDSNESQISDRNSLCNGSSSRTQCTVSIGSLNSSKTTGVDSLKKRSSYFTKTMQKIFPLHRSNSSVSDNKLENKSDEKLNTIKPKRGSLTPHSNVFDTISKKPRLIRQSTCIPKIHGNLQQDKKNK